MWDDSAKGVLHNIRLFRVKTRLRTIYLKPLFGPKISAETDLGDFKLCFNLFNPPGGFFNLSPARIEHDVSAQQGLVIWPTRLLTGSVYVSLIQNGGFKHL